MRDDAILCLRRSWAVLVRLVIEISLSVSLVRPMPRAARNKALRLTRLAEAIARRWLVLKACELRATNKSSLIPAKAGISCHSSASRLNPIPAFAGMSGGGVINPRPPLFRLVEPQPRFKRLDTLFEDACQQYGLDLSSFMSAEPGLPSSAHPGLDPGSRPTCPDLPNTNSPEPGSCAAQRAVAEPASRRVGEALSAAQNSEANQTHLWVRSRALIDVIRRPEANAKRMARWLSRAAHKASTQAARRHPLRIGRAPGRVKQDARGKGEDARRQQILRDLHFFAQEALATPAPP